MFEDEDHKVSSWGVSTYLQIRTVAPTELRWTRPLCLVSVGGIWKITIQIRGVERQPFLE